MAYVYVGRKRFYTKSKSTINQGFKGGLGMSCGKYDSIHAVMDFTEVLKKEPEKAFDFITCNAYRLEKDDLVNILKEVLFIFYILIYKI